MKIILFPSQISLIRLGCPVNIKQGEQYNEHYKVLSSLLNFYQNSLKSSKFVGRINTVMNWVEITRNKSEFV